MSLRDHVRNNDWNALEEAWTEIILSEGPIDSVVDAMLQVAKRKEMPRCLHLVKEHADMLVSSKRAEEASKLLGIAMLKGGSPGELGGPLLAAATEAYGDKSWWESFTDLTGFREGATDLRAAWGQFHKLLSLREGGAVYHASGWGVGGIEAVDLEAREIDVRFSSGKRDRFPLSSALEIFDILDETDLRSMLVTNPDELRRVLREEPLEVLRDVTRRYENRVTYGSLRTALTQMGLDGSAFTGWWRKARKAAEGSEWFEVSGTSTKAVVRLLTDAADPVQSLRRQLQRSATLRDALKRVREVVSGTQSADGMREAAVEILQQLAAEDTHPLPDRISAWLLIREQTGETPPSLAALLEEAMAMPAAENPGDPPALWRLFGALGSAREHEACIPLLEEIHGEAWIDEALEAFPHAPQGMVRGLIEALLEAGRQEELGAHYKTLLARPVRNPHALVLLAEMAEKGRLAGEFPPAPQRLESLVRLAGHCYSKSAGDPFLTRTRARIASLLGGPKGLIRKLLQGSERTTLQTIRVLIERGVDDSIDAAFTNVAVELVPDFFSRDELPFWEGGAIWTTRAGLERRQAELRELKEVKIPANAEAIGRAASFGDLSENSEWESALEEQRNLTSRASELEAELRDVNLLEDAPLSEGKVSPGTRVRYRELATGEEHTMSIVGPWDTEDFADPISYRAPLAKGLLGLSAGERGVVEPPTGPVEVEVLEVAPLDLTPQPESR